MMSELDAGNIAFNLFATIILYGAFPVIFSATRKRPIQRKKFRLYCIVVTIIECLAISIVMSFAGGGVSSGAPALLWGVIFYKVGIATLKSNSVLIDETSDQKLTENDPNKRSVESTDDQNNDTDKPESKDEIETQDTPEDPITKVVEEHEKRGPKNIEKDTFTESSVRFCYKCGNELIEGSKYCNNCGTKVWTGEEP